MNDPHETPQVPPRSPETPAPEGVDVTTGHLVVADHAVRIGPTLTRRAMEASPLFAAAEHFVGGEPDRSWKIAGLRIGGLSWCVVLRYRGDQLERVELDHDDPKYGKSWDDWTPTLELEKRARQEEWLDAALGPEREFAWGSVAHVKDAHYGTFAIVIRYRV